MQTERVNVRFPADMNAWLLCRKEENRSTLNAEILGVIREAMKRDPLTIYVHECKTPDGVFYAVSIGKFGDDFHEGDIREDAFAAARAKTKELDLPRSAIRFEIEDFTDAA